jgi:molecular chaperone DnaK (HSP70)
LQGFQAPRYAHPHEVLVLVQCTFLALFIASVLITSNIQLFLSFASTINHVLLEKAIWIDVVRPITLSGTQNSTLAEITERLVPSGQTLPVSSSIVLVNLEDEQRTLDINLYQEEVIELPQGHSRQEFRTVFRTIIDIPPRPAGTLQASVSVTVDEDKLLRLNVAIPEVNLTKEYEPFLVQ